MEKKNFKVLLKHIETSAIDIKAKDEVEAKEKAEEMWNGGMIPIHDSDDNYSILESFCSKKVTLAGNPKYNNDDIKILILDPEYQTDRIRHNLLALYYDGYYNTDIDTEVFSREFYRVAGIILDNGIPIDLKYLETEDLIDEIVYILQNH